MKTTLILSEKEKNVLDCAMSVFLHMWFGGKLEDGFDLSVNDVRSLTLKISEA